MTPEPYCLEAIRPPFKVDYRQRLQGFTRMSITM